MTRLLVLLAIGLSAATATAGFAATLSVSSWHLWAGRQTLTKSVTPCTVTGAAADTFVDQASPTSPNSGGATIDALADSGSQRWAFLRFDLSTCNIPPTGGADSATLRLYMTKAPARTFTLTLARVLGAWSTTLTWNGAQSLSYAAATATAPSGTTAGWVTFTVTGDVDQFIHGLTTNNGWAVTASGSTQNANKDLIQFASSSAAANKPQLVVDYEK